MLRYFCMVLLLVVFNLACTTQDDSREVPATRLPTPSDTPDVMEGLGVTPTRGPTAADLPTPDTAPGHPPNQNSKPEAVATFALSPTPPAWPTLPPVHYPTVKTGPTTLATPTSAPTAPPPPVATSTPAPTPTTVPTATPNPAPTPVPPTPTPPPTPVPPTASGLAIECIFFDGKVTRTEADEYVQIVNSGRNAADLDGWRLVDIADESPTFTFSPYIVEPGGRVRVYTNEIHPEWGGFSFGRGSSIWNNGKPDTAGLFDPAGLLKSTKTYPPGC